MTLSLVPAGLPRAAGGGVRRRRARDVLHLVYLPHAICIGLSSLISVTPAASGSASLLLGPGFSRVMICPRGGPAARLPSVIRAGPSRLWPARSSSGRSSALPS